MLRVERIADLRQELAMLRRRGLRIGFVPTMGALHEGHLSLIRDCAKQSDVVVTSIFVNPLQFGPSEDFTRYPRDADADVAKAGSVGAQICFVPSVQEMYPAVQKIAVAAGKAALRWEGAVRPGHFDGVLTVVAKLLNIVNPDVSLFGQKDYQQAVLVRSMVRELSFATAIVIAPTVRDHDGLALSSRNAYLSPEMRAKASALPRSLARLIVTLQGGEANAARLCDVAASELANGGLGTPEYLAIVDGESLEPVDRADRHSVALLAVRAGGTRLIDNVLLGGDMPPGLAAALLPGS